MEESGNHACGVKMSEVITESEVKELKESIKDELERKSLKKVKGVKGSQSGLLQPAVIGGLPNYTSGKNQLQGQHSLV